MLPGNNCQARPTISTTLSTSCLRVAQDIWKERTRSAPRPYQCPCSENRVNHVSLRYLLILVLAWSNSETDRERSQRHHLICPDAYEPHISDRAPATYLGPLHRAKPRAFLFRQTAMVFTYKSFAFLQQSTRVKPIHLQNDANKRFLP